MLGHWEIRRRLGDDDEAVTRRGDFCGDYEADSLS